jgi:NAD(P)-dependent dehydrogenase (short-subunit alcohol dehydrogenase family)
VAGNGVALFAVDAPHEGGVLAGVPFARVPDQIGHPVAHQLAQRAPGPHGGKPAGHREAVVFLCSEAASYITGITLPVEGGQDYVR